MTDDRAFACYEAGQVAGEVARSAPSLEYAHSRFESEKARVHLLDPRFGIEVRR